MGCPTSTPQITPCWGGGNHQSQPPHPQTQPTHHSIYNPDSMSHFPTIDWTDRQTNDWLKNCPGDKTCTNSPTRIDYIAIWLIITKYRMRGQNRRHTPQTCHQWVVAVEPAAEAPVNQISNSFHVTILTASLHYYGVPIISLVVK